MVSIYINGDKIDAQLDGEKTVGDVLVSFEKTCEENEAAVIGILLDGKPVTAEIYDETAKLPLGEDTKFDFNVITKQAIKDSFKNLSSLFEELAEKMEKVPLELQNGNKKEASESIKNVADSIDSFCHVAALATLFPESFNATTIGDKSFKDFFADFSPILLDFEQALQNNDSIMIGDLAEYEICPRLKEISESLKSF